MSSAIPPAGASAIPEPAPAVRIPFNRACFVGAEQEYMRQAVAAGQISGDGPFTRRCHDFLEAAIGVPRVLLTTSCTHALEMSALLLDLKPGDEVIVPAFTFVSTANAYALRGARLVFADIQPDTLNIDAALLPGLISDRTRAIVVVHYAGVGCEMDAIMKLAEERGIAVIEDNAHGLFATYRDRALGTFGRFATLSFHETKNFTCGEGGALLLNDLADVQRAEVVREKGTNRSNFFRGLTDKYTWVDVGSSYLPSDLLAAMLLAQLEHREQIQDRRRDIWERYDQGLAAWAADGGVTRPHVPPHCRQSFHMYHLLMPTDGARDGLLAHLRRRGILAVFHYLPLHLSPMGERMGGRPGQCPVTEDVAGRLLRLPFYQELDHDLQDEVVGAVREFSNS